MFKLLVVRKKTSYFSKKNISNQVLFTQTIIKNGNKYLRDSVTFPPWASHIIGTKHEHNETNRGETLRETFGDERFQFSRGLFPSSSSASLKLNLTLIRQILSSINLHPHRKRQKSSPEGPRWDDFFYQIKNTDRFEKKNATKTELMWQLAG